MSQQIEGLPGEAPLLESATSQFPTRFFWGAATSAYQIEGAAAEDGRGPSIWDQFASTPGATYEGHTGAVSVDHYHRLPEDLALMQKLGLNAYCFSLSWSRILPEGTGRVNQPGLDYYARVIDSLLAAGITPIVKLYHWDLPLALHNRGGWLSRDTAYAFADYTALVAQNFGDRVPYWITHNEPWCTAFLGYGIGIHAPGIRDLQSAIDVAHHVLLSHGLAMGQLRTHTAPGTRAGIAPNLYPVYPARQDSATLAATDLADAFKNRWFLDPIFCGHYPATYFDRMRVNPPPIQPGDMQIIAAPIDFLGVNYYSRTLVEATTDEHEALPFKEAAVIPGSEYTEMGWEIYPQGLTDMLVRLHQDYQPTSLIITENGAAFPDHWDGADRIADTARQAFFDVHIQAVYSAIQQGAPVDGYFAWSLLDNFEWAEGYNKRFGITYVDYPTQRRILKDSGLWYASFVKRQRGL